MRWDVEQAVFEPDIRRMIANYLWDLARWRRQRAEEYDRDARNLQCAAGLDDLADYVLSLPEDDERLEQLSRLAVSGDVFEPGQQAHFAMARFRFHQPDVSCDAFLDHVVELQIADAGEMGAFGGDQWLWDRRSRDLPE
jgi:hypothetical protein